jgi:hypothetical protein
VAAKEVIIPRGKWVRIDQEVVLNTPQKQDGLVRLWVDGSLRIEGKEAELRYSREVGFTGVMGDVHFGGNFMGGVARKDETVWLTPFELRWN